jgi:O-acetyl-ADP-ribose deacetylase (regulator of RNase III)
MAPPEPHRYFNGLKIQSRLGEGAMGEAWLASHPILRVAVVVKTYRAVEPDDLFREAHLAARVQSPHVVAVIHAGVVDLPFVVQRYVDGIDGQELLDWMRRLGITLSLDAALRFVVGLARGLHAIHQAGVVHRDLKPANFFLAADGTPMIGDFGIACDPLSERASRRGREPEHVLGTPSFIAPEVLAGRPVARTSDIYSLGVTATLLATGGIPREPTIVLGRRGRRREPEVIHGDPSLRSPLHDPYFAAVERMLHSSPSQRFQSCQQIVAALAPLVPPPLAFQHQEPGRARIGTLTIRLAHGDLTTTAADVLVNAANDSLWMSAGVALALREAGGARIEQEAIASAPARMGEVVWTTAGELQADFVAHAVAAFDGAICIGRCVLRVLFGAALRERRTIAMPALGTGIGLVPMSLSAQLTLEALRTFASLATTSVTQVTIILTSAQSVATWAEVLASM